MCLGLSNHEIDTYHSISSASSFHKIDILLGILLEGTTRENENVLH